MTRVRIRGGYLNIGRRTRPGGGPVDPDYGVDEGEPVYPEGPEVEPPEIPEPPPGIWPPLTPGNPWRPIDPGFGVGRPPHVGGGPARPERPTDPDFGIPELPPGSIWPPLPEGVHGKYLALVLIGGGGHGAHYRYVVIDADAIVGHPEHPIVPGEPIPPREPKR
jgi:hypothetical protein